MLVKKKDIIFNNLPNNALTEGNIQNLKISRYPSQGEVIIHGSLSNSLPVPGQLFSFVITGLAADGVTTVIISNQDLGLSDYLPSKVPKILVQQTIIDRNLIQNYVSGASLSPRDIELDVLHPNDQEGQLIANVRLTNNKGLNKGQQLESIDLGVARFFGFKRAEPKPDPPPSPPSPPTPTPPPVQPTPPPPSPPETPKQDTGPTNSSIGNNGLVGDSNSNM